MITRFLSPFCVAAIALSPAAAGAKEADPIQCIASRIDEPTSSAIYLGFLARINDPKVEPISDQTIEKLLGISVPCFERVPLEEETFPIIFFGAVAEPIIGRSTAQFKELGFPVARIDAVFVEELRKLSLDRIQALNFQMPASMEEKAEELREALIAETGLEENEAIGLLTVYVTGLFGRLAGERLLADLPANGVK